MKAAFMKSSFHENQNSILNFCWKLLWYLFLSIQTQTFKSHLMIDFMYCNISYTT